MNCIIESLNNIKLKIPNRNKKIISFNIYKKEFVQTYQLKTDTFNLKPL